MTKTYAIDKKPSEKDINALVWSLTLNAVQRHCRFFIVAVFTVFLILGAVVLVFTYPQIGLVIAFPSAIALYVFLVRYKIKLQVMGQLKSSAWEPNTGVAPDCLSVNAEYQDGSIAWNRDPKSLDWCLHVKNPIVSHMKKR